jgi:phenylacetate-CoA ligase
MMPWIARRIVYPLQECALRRPTFACFAELERTQWLPRDRLEEIQLSKLNRLLQLALRHSPWHARRFEGAGLSGRIARGEVDFADLRKLPPMTKSDAREHRDEIAWPGVPGGTFRYTTGGSTGAPLIFYFGRARQASDAANRLRARRWWGVEPGDPEVYLWGSPVELSGTDRVKSLRDRLLNQLVLNAFAMTSARMDSYLDAIEGWGPASIYGYASSLALLAAHAERRGRRLRLPRLRVVCTTGEPLYPHQRSLIGRAFGSPVANEFGSRDSGLLAHEAPGGYLLQMTESNLLEVLDHNDQPCPPGVAGEAVVTGFDSAAQPFIRYRTGDVVSLSNARDPAGRGLVVLASVTGRQTDFLVAEDGTIMHALAAIYVLRAIEGVESFKCVQHSVRELQVLVVPNRFWRDSAAGLIANGLRSRLGNNVAIRLELVTSIPPEASGKHRYVVSHVPPPSG